MRYLEVMQNKKKSQKCQTSFGNRSKWPTNYGKRLKRHKFWSIKRKVKKADIKANIQFLQLDNNYNETS